MTPDGTLVIRNTKEKDGGVYGCLASNSAGTDTMTSILTYFGECSNHSAKYFYGSDFFVPDYFKLPCFLEFPVVRATFREVLSNIGETTVLSCSASGIPKPEIWWYKGNS